MARHVGGGIEIRAEKKDPTLHRKREGHRQVHLRVKLWRTRRIAPLGASRLSACLKSTNKCADVLTMDTSRAARTAVGRFMIEPREVMQYVRTAAQ